jgi:hypothetical protein
MNARKERLMQPRKQAATMATRDLASSVATGHRALRPDLHAVLLFFQKDGDQQSQRTASATCCQWSN